MCSAPSGRLAGARECPAGIAATRGCKRTVFGYDKDVQKKNKTFAYPEVHIHGDIKRTNLILDSNLLHEFAHVYVSQLDKLQEYRRAIAAEFEALDNAAEFVESLAHMGPVASAVPVTVSCESVFNYRLGAAAVIPDVAFCVDGNIVAVEIKASAIDCSPVELDVSAPSLHLPQPESYERRITAEELGLLLADVAATTRAKARSMRRVLRSVTEAITIVREVAFKEIAVFCSLRWERRRWYLHHGARPPRASQAIWSLFAGARSGPAIAN
jgi:hypothetical protein